MGIDFQDPEVFKKLETDCYKAGCEGRTIDYSSFPAAEYRYFERLCYVYRRYHCGEISLDDAKAQKLIFFKDYKNDLEQYNNYLEICRKHRETIKATEMLCSALCKLPIKTLDDVENALKQALAVISAAREENVTEKTVLGKLEGVSTSMDLEV